MLASPAAADLTGGWLLPASLLAIAVLAALAAWALLRLRRLRAELKALKGRDPVTGLADRAALERALADAVTTADACGGEFGVVHVGLDGFRAVNETYGLRVGDTVLAEVGERLARAIGRQGRIARVGGDEFVAVVPRAQGDADMLADELQRALTEPLKTEALALRLGLSIGFAFYPDDGARAHLMRHAAQAMRSVKRTGGNGHARYEASMSADQREQFELLRDLRQAVARGELQLVYQPKVDARSQQVTAAEALLRWKHPRRGLVSPAQFIPLAERHGLIRPIGAWVIEEALRQAARWRESGLRMRIAVNISDRQLRAEGFVEQLLASAERHGVPPNRLTVEITETVALEDTAVTRDAFERLRKAGLHVSIDDFGAGYSSSLATIRRIAPSELKIDAALVSDVATNAQSRHIAAAIVQMAHSLQMRVVAEGVETEAQRDALVALDCDELQGFLFARPMSAKALGLWAMDEQPKGASQFRPSLFEPTRPAQAG